MLKKKIKRYVDRVVSYLPILERRKARLIITESIYARLEDLTTGMRPTRQDLYSVLREMGSPESLADAYYEDFYRPLYKRIDIQKMLQGMLHGIMILALTLVVVGMVDLLMGAENMKGLMVGLILAVIAVFGKMIVQIRTSLVADGRS